MSAEETEDLRTSALSVLATEVDGRARQVAEWLLDALDMVAVVTTLHPAPYTSAAVSA